MKQIWFVLLILVMIVVTGCSTPISDSPKVETKSETPIQPNAPTNPEAPSTPPTIQPEPPAQPETPEQPASPSYSAGDSARENITFGGVTYAKTGEVYVTGPSGATITGATNTNNYEGVFIAGRNVTLSPYIMGKYEVTQQLYTAVMTNQIVTVGGTEFTFAASPFYSSERDYCPKVRTDIQNLRPAEGVCWFDAVYFCNKLSEKLGLTPAYDITITTMGSGSMTGHIRAATVTIVENANGYRLPTEAEWEFAARGGNPLAEVWNYTFSGAAIAEETLWTQEMNPGLDTVGWYYYNLPGGVSDSNAELNTSRAGYGTHEVGKKGENTLHIFDMSGNVTEWCYDLYEYEDNPGTISCRIIRGGGFNGGARSCSVCYRSYASPDGLTYSRGFRVVRNAN